MNTEKKAPENKQATNRKTTPFSFEKPFVSAKLADTFGSHIISRDLRDFENSPNSQILGTGAKEQNQTMHPRISW